MFGLFDRLVQRPRSLRSAPRDGTRILGLFSGHEWQEIYWDMFAQEWRAGHPLESRKVEEPKAWRAMPGRS